MKTDTFQQRFQFPIGILFRCNLRISRCNI